MTKARMDLSELDLALIDALHREPRAPFTRLAAAIGSSASAVRRRYLRLTDSGLVWTSSAPGPTTPVALAIANLTCKPAAVRAVAQRAALLPNIHTVHILSGGQQVQANAIAVDQQALTRLIIDEVIPMEGVVGVDVVPISTWRRDFRWNLGALEPASATMLVETQRPQPGTVRNRLERRTFNDMERALFAALQQDGRATIAELEAKTGIPDDAIRRHLNQAIRNERIAVRTDFARPLGGWATQVMLRVACPDERLAEVTERVQSLPEVRHCYNIVSASNLLVNAQVHSVGSICAVSARVTDGDAEIRIVDRAIVLSTLKAWGRLIAPDGRAVSMIPLDLGRPPGENVEAPSERIDKFVLGDAEWPP